MKAVRTKRPTARFAQTKEDRTASEQRYQQLVEDSLGLICIHDLKGKLLYVNPAATEALGYQRREWRGKNLQQFLAPAVRPFFPAYLDRIHKRPIDTGMMYVFTKAGEERIWMYQNRRYDEPGQSSYVLGHALDVTEFMQAQKALHASEERFRALIEHSSEMIAVLDAEGAVRYESPSAVRVLGYAMGESIGRDGFSFVHPEDAPEAMERFARLIQQPGLTLRQELRVRHQNGSWRILEVTVANLLHEPAIQGVVINSRDITQRKEAEDALRQYAERVKILHELDQAILAAQSSAAIAQVALQYIRRLVPCRRASIVTFHAEAGEARVLATLTDRITKLDAGMRFPLTHFGDLKPLRQGSAIVIEDLLSVSQLSPFEQNLRAEGIRASVGIPLLSEGELIGALYIGAEHPGFFEPHSVQIAREVANPIAIAIRQNYLYEAVQRHAEALEQEVQERTAELQAREKLAATGRMAARIAHEINNPLAGIKNAFRLIKDAVPANHPYIQYVSRIDKEIDRIAGIVQQMFDLYRPEHEEPRTFRLNEAIHDVIALLEPSCRQYGVHIVVQLRRPAGVVHLPEGAVRQVLFNLLVNAIEASPQGGIVEVQVRLHEGDLKIEVADQGKGIPQEIHAQIFEPFFTTKEGTPRRGLGLGLSISKSLVEAMNGHIEFRSRTPQGMIFQVTLPHPMSTQKEKRNG